GCLSVVPLDHQEGALDYADAQTPMEQFVATTRMGFVHVPAPELSDNVKANKMEAEVVADIVEALIHLNARSDKSLNLSKQLGIIVPFRNQISMVRASLRNRGVADVDDITIDTVECYQGSQRDYIVFTTTISRPYQLDILSVCQQVGTTEVDRKLNVAITRARKQFFLVGNRDLLSRNALYADLISRCDVR
ncbi:MAG: C-terminal helicase domain-containing protein, partial [Prevotellamassilia sp.]|nr:C-terminal helicase domain-containing protein [Prevotellamassilia sp.]